MLLMRMMSIIVAIILMINVEMNIQERFWIGTFSKNMVYLQLDMRFKGDNYEIMSLLKRNQEFY